MFCRVRVWVFLLSFWGRAFAQSSPHDYTSDLIRLSELTSQKQYRQALDGYRRLAAQPGTPGWLKAACEYEIAELYGSLHDTENAAGALGRAVELGYDDCLTPRSVEPLKAVVQTARAMQALAKIRIRESDLRELAWLKAEVEHANHDTRMMITENINRVDQRPTDIPQAQIPNRPSTSAGVLYWRQQLLEMQRVQREYVQKSDLERITHATKMGMIGGGRSTAAALESARRAQAAAELRRAEIRKRAFVPATPASDEPKACSESH